jgi:2-keto-4-pentenoate hydratase
MLDQTTVGEVSAMLVRHWNDGTRLDTIPEDLRPTTREEGYWIQSALMDTTSAPLFGWKIAATSLAGQRHINVDGPLAGRLLAERLIEDGATVALAGNRIRVAELEFAFRFGEDLRPRSDPYTVEEVMDAVATLHPAIELPDSRFSDYTAVGTAQLIADNACAHLFLPGPAVETEWRHIDLATYEVSAVVNGATEQRGVGSNVLGDPRIALTWLVNELSGLGIPLRAGEMVTTGTCVLPIAITEGDRVEADFGEFGALSVRFA